MGTAIKKEAELQSGREAEEQLRHPEGRKPEGSRFFAPLGLRMTTLLISLPLCFSASLLLCSPAAAQTTVQSQEVPTYGMVLKPIADLDGLQEKISLDLRETNILDVLKFLGQRAGVNIVAGPAIEGRVSLFLKEVSIENALQIILLSNGLAYRQHSNILYIMKEDEYTALYGETYRDQRIVRVIPLEYANPTTVATFLGSTKSSIGKIIVDDGTGTLVLIDVPEKIALMQEVIQKLDIASVVREVPLETHVFELQYTKAADIQAEVAKIVTPAGRLQADTKSNTLIISDVKSQIKHVRKVIKAFDRKIRQVFIETKLIQVRLEDRYFMGVDWETLHSGQKFHGMNFKSDFDISSSATKTGKFAIGSLTRDNYTFLIQALQTFGDTETLAGPQLAAVNGEEATILIGTKEAYVTSTVSQAQSTTTTSEDITFIDVGVKLKVKPEINRDGYVKMTVTPEVSSVGRTLTTANNNSIPIVDTTNTTTTVLVKDGYTVLIGGLIKDELSKSVSKFPLLGDIPWVGSIFRNVDDKRVKTELVVLLTPHIIDGDEENPFFTASGKEFFPLRDIAIEKEASS